MKFIREARFGPPKTWKSGSLLDSYPTPIGLLAWDQGGWEIAKKRKWAIVTLEEWKQICYGKMPPPADITIINCSFAPTIALHETGAPVPEGDTFRKTTNAVNYLVEGAGVYGKMKAEKFPFKTVIGDPITELSKSVHRWISANNAARLADPRKWAGDVGAKVEQVISYLNSLPVNQVCHVITVFHNEIKENEETKQVRNLPMVFSNLKYSIGGLYSQFFYQDIISGKPQVRHAPFDLVSGVGARWPEFPGNTTLVGPLFEDIYGREKDVLR